MSETKKQDKNGKGAGLVKLGNGTVYPKSSDGKITVELEGKVLVNGS